MENQPLLKVNYFAFPTSLPSAIQGGTELSYFILEFDVKWTYHFHHLICLCSSKYISKILGCLLWYYNLRGDTDKNDR